MTPAERLLLAAKRCEIDDLEHLSAACDIVGDVSRFIHALQKERGASNVYLASGGQRFADRRRERINECKATERALHSRLEALGETAGRPATTARLLKRVAFVWHALEGLDALRRDIAALGTGPDAATQSYNQLISSLLSVVFEVADTADDPEITLALVAIFHLMQGKELAGQERACGAVGFTSGEFDDVHRQLLLHLIDAQQRCFDIFREFTTEPGREQWQQQMPPRTLAGIQQLREMACGDSELPEGATTLGETWYELTTRRIDAMQQVEAYLIGELSSLCLEKTLDARRGLADHDDLAKQLDEASPGVCQQLVELFEGSATQELGEVTARVVGSSLNRSLVELMRAQAGRLESLGDELENTRRALRERKLIERAKGLIMSHQKLSEEQAYAFLRKMAMDQSKGMAEIAQTVLGLADILQPAALNANPDGIDGSKGSNGASQNRNAPSRRL
ncbi:nitrate regulatory protein [Billgrantia kenyensis]|uniref:ANTAR domain-containing protein n=1 Tax=Billgrantia kenyensis TaxID=321266 RepID=A0A7V9W3N2_9GAMM|nr:nitrate regulatory protein [Halomonas kenyensis]MBA2780467.1 nitrate- and nitrite sensing domain-containing protein [Halomonas kenyensis]MCG6662381.1 ANTAR domain-containing protein [Halomonas kenyensis]